MPSHSQLDNDEIKHQVSIEKVLVHYGRTPVAGKMMQCLFPEHHNNHDADPSMDLYGDRVFCRTQKCFGDKGADIFGVVKVMEHLTYFKDQRKRIIELFNLVPGHTNGTWLSNNKNIIRAHKWMDPEGRTAYHMRTKNPKHKFIWNQQPDGSGAWELKPCKPDLYEREQVIRAQSGIVCAGERDCDTVNGWLKDLGRDTEIVATCNHIGESSVKAESFTLLHGKEQVWVIGDNDATGEFYRQQVCTFLQGKVDA